jgi:CheY-like chemotaxis protein
LPPFPSKNTILIVDDEPVNIKALEIVLGEEHDLAYATTGEMALEMAQAILSRT